MSSGEAEFYGAVKGAGAGLGFQALLSDLGVESSLTVFTDSTAAIGIASRQGLGKLRHLDVHTLWLQQAVRSKRLKLRKVPGEENPGDAFTKHLPTREKLAEVMRLFDVKFESGRAESAPRLRREERQRVEMRDINDEAEQDAEEGLYVLPHLMDERTLEENFPAVQAADDWDEFNVEELNGPNFLEMAGDRVAKQVMEEARKFGRRRVVPKQPVNESESLSPSPAM
jgi:hypothetical protein